MRVPAHAAKKGAVSSAEDVCLIGVMFPFKVHNVLHDCVVQRLIEIKGLSEAKVDKLVEAARGACPWFGIMSARDFEGQVCKSSQGMKLSVLSVAKYITIFTNSQTMVRSSIQRSGRSRSFTSPPAAKPLMSCLVEALRARR